jgi:hypothetical protein
MLLYILLVGFYQLKMSISLEKRVILAASNHVDAAPQFPTQNATIQTEFNPINSTRGMSACLLVMDDTIKLTEWLAYHYTVLPLSHLIVAIDPASVLENEINKVLSLWNTRMYIEVWTNDTWMTLPPDKGWPPSAYFPNKKLNRKRIARKHSLQHVRPAFYHVYILKREDFSLFFSCRNDDKSTLPLSACVVSNAFILRGSCIWIPTSF